MKTFDIHPVDRSMQAVIQAKIDNLNKLVLSVRVSVYHLVRSLGNK